jgi:hypothetical protein
MAKFMDIVSFDFESSKAKEYGFSSVLVLGKDIRIYQPTEHITTRPAVAKSSDAEQLKRTAKFFELIYLTTYETDVALLAVAAAKEKAVLIAITDILEKEGLQRAIAINRVSRFIKFCKSYKVQIHIATLANNQLGARTAEEIVAICSLLGLDKKETENAMGPLSVSKEE